ncbi:CG7024, partial [Drosophila busckii]
TFKCYELDKGPPTDVDLSREDALAMYQKMVEIRRLEMMAGDLYKKKSIRGFCHLYTGQEAVAVGMAAALRKQDSVITAYRAHGWTYVMGVPIYSVLAELVGARTGCSRGKGGSMHTYGDNFYGGNGIVGAQVPVGAGIALAHAYKGDGGVCLALYGDGAANQGQVFEAYNMAKLWCLPCIFVCENNNYAMGTSVNRHSAIPDFYMRGQYIPGLWVDGNQVLAVRSATQFAIEYVLKRGPIVLEMFTYRYEGHSMSDPGISYRTRDEIQKMRKARDPIESLRNQIIKLCLGTEVELKKIDADVRKSVADTTAKLLKDKEIELDELATDVYAKTVDKQVRGISGYSLVHKRLSEICFGKPKRTPPEEIKDVPVGDAALVAAQQKAKAAADAKKAAEAAKDDKAKPPADPKAAAAAKPAAAAAAKPAAAADAKAATPAPPPAPAA